MKFLHAADIHLDSPLSGLAGRPADERLERALRGCTRRAFSALVDLALAEDVAFLVIAGDLYDGDWKDFSTGLFFAQEMRRLGRPCLLLRGNHDAASLITKRLPAIANVREFSARAAETLELAPLRVALHGRSFPDRAVPEDLSEGYPDPKPGWLNIGVLHTSADDAGGEHATYAPCDPARLRLKGYDYWALGHIHQRRVLAERPWIVFPGNLQGRHAKETGPKGATLVTVEGTTITAVEHRSLDVLRWAALDVDAAGADPSAIERRIAEAVRAACAGAEGRPLLARLALRGETALHGGLADRAEEFAALATQAAIEADAQLWIEKVQLRTRAPRDIAADTLAPLRAAFFAALEDPAVAAGLRADLDGLRARTPAPVRAALDVAELATLAEEAWGATVAALQAEQGG